MNSFRKLFGIISIIAIIVCVMVACDLSGSGYDSDPSQTSGTNTYKPVVYTGNGSDSTRYELTITRSSKSVVQFTPATGDSYTLTSTTAVGVTKTSIGTVKDFSGNKFTLTASNNSSVFFEVTIINNAITNITGTITFEGGSTVNGPGSLTTTNGFVAVTEITGVPSGALFGTPITLTGTVAPSDATNKTIVWSIKNAGTTGATISGNTLSTTASGTVTVTATIANGKTASTPYTQDFTLTITSTFVAVTGITGFPTGGTAGTPIALSGTVAPSDATNKTIVWSVKSAGTTGATISGNTLTATAAGSVTVTATIANGKTASTPYTQDFTINISSGGGVQSGTYGDFEYVINGGSVTITKYKGTAANVSIPVAIEGKPVTSIKKCYGTNLTSVTIPDSVTSIGERAFSGTKLTSVTIPASVTSIGRGAFATGNDFNYPSGSTLTEINVASGNNAYTSENGVLYNKNKTAIICYPDGKAGSFNIPNTVLSIEDDLFSYCFFLTSVTIPNSVTSIGERAFDYCTNLASVTIGNSVSSIGNGAFSGTKLTSVTIPNSVSSIGNGAFSGTKLTSVTIPNSVSSIKDNAFGDCTSLISVTFEGTNASYDLHNDAFGRSGYSSIGDLRAKYLAGGTGTYTRPNTGYDGTWTKTFTFSSIAAFQTWLNAQPENTVNTAYYVALNISSLEGLRTVLQNVSNKYVNLDLSGSTLTSIWEEAFVDCRSLTGVTIPNSATSIKKNAFYLCSNLTSVTIPNSVTSIENLAFYLCTALTSVTIPDSVTSIEGGGVFEYCISLTAIDVAQGNNSFTAENSILYNKNKTAIIYCPAGKTGSFTIPNNVTSIGQAAFVDSCLTNVTIPNSVTSIERSAFYGASLTSVTIPDSVTSIGDAVFAHCVSLASVTIGNSVPKISQSAFWECSSLTNVTIPNNVKSIDFFAFGVCTNLTSVTFQGTISSNNLHNNAFGTYESKSTIGDLRDKYLAGGPGTYKRPDTGIGGAWTKQ